MKTTKQEIQNFLISFIEKTFLYINTEGIESAVLKGRIDSLDVIELVMGIEDEYNIKIPNDEVQGWKKFQDIVDSVYKKLK